MQIEIPAELAAAVAEIAEKSGRDAQSVIAEMVTEAIKMRRVPGIVFADGATGRRARVGGTGIEVFEVIDVYELFDRDVERLARELPQLASHQIDMAIAYYEAYPEDILPRLKSDEQVEAEMEELWSAHPQTRPPWRRTQQGNIQPNATAIKASA